MKDRVRRDLPSVQNTKGRRRMTIRAVEPTDKISYAPSMRDCAAIVIETAANAETDCLRWIGRGQDGSWAFGVVVK